LSIIRWKDGSYTTREVSETMFDGTLFLTLIIAILQLVVHYLPAAV
jgi:hypothetical protein